jgi:hypothetical protein
MYLNIIDFGEFNGICHQNGPELKIIVNIVCNLKEMDMTLWVRRLFFKLTGFLNANRPDPIKIEAFLRD